MFLLVLKYDGDNSEAKIGYAMMALEAYGCNKKTHGFVIK